MSDAERNIQAGRLYRSASEDLRAARAALEEADFRPRHACLFAQQAAEKALKAALTLDNVRFPWKHDLDALRLLLPARWSLANEAPDLHELSVWAVAARYPGDLPEATEADARKSIEVASEVVDAIASDVTAHGITVDDWLAPDQEYGADEPEG